MQTPKYKISFFDNCYSNTANEKELIFDEILDYFRKATEQPIILGFTATPARTDNISLSSVYADIAYVKNIRELISEGYLSPIKGYRITTDTDLNGVRSHRGDFYDEDLAKAVDIDTRNKLIIKSYKEQTPGKQAIVFCASIDHAEHVAKLFLDQGISAACMSERTPEKERQKLEKKIKELDKYPDYEAENNRQSPQVFSKPHRYPWQWAPH
jgi:ATP-dependent helicase IRC3